MPAIPDEDFHPEEVVSNLGGGQSYQLLKLYWGNSLESRREMSKQRLKTYTATIILSCLPLVLMRTMFILAGLFFNIY